MGAGLNTYATAPHEPSSWMRQQIALRLQAVIERGLDPYSPDPLIIAPLGTTGVPGSRADRECDRCGEFVAAGTDLWCIIVAAAAGLRLCGGLCSHCWALEGCPSGECR